MRYIAETIRHYMREEASGGLKHLFMISTYCIGKERIFWKVDECSQEILWSMR